MSLPSFVRRYLLVTLEGTPTVLEHLLSTIPNDASLWDAQYVPERFTLREVLAHLTDWEEVFFTRIVRTRDEDQPTLQALKPDDLAVNYASRDPFECLTLFRQRRAQIVEAVLALTPDEWERDGHFPPGHPIVDCPVTIEAWVTQIVAHDGYHTRQIAEYLSQGKGR